MARSIREIAREAKADWAARSKNGVSPHAKPYLEAMLQLDSVSDMYGLDTARDIVLRFLCNAASWRGETARRIKQELNEMMVIK